jgi:hypothetical protein
MGGFEARDVVVTAAAFLGGYLGQVRTRRALREVVGEALRPRVRRYWVALAGLSRRVRQLEQAGADRAA